MFTSLLSVSTAEEQGSVRMTEEQGFTGICVYITVVSEDGREVGFYRDVCLHYCFE